MTTHYKEKIRCALCNSDNEVTGISSTNTFGFPDLDLRPPEMQRSTIFAWVQRCRACGYCASDLSKSPPGSRDVVTSEEYRNQLNEVLCPELAKSFKCKAIVDREAKRYASATWALIHAAWVCDDSDRPDQAAACRQKAADMLLVAEKHGQRITEEAGASKAILVDLLRRSGQLDQAREAIAIARAGVADDTIVCVLDFQACLIEKGDMSAHTIAEAMGEGG